MRLLMSVILSVGVSGSVCAEPGSNAILEELRTAPRPKQQNDLDTLQIASAHRERADSVQEKTNGLWQSWLTSVCEGCGDTPSYQKTVGDDFAKRKSLADRGSGTTDTIEPPTRSWREKREQYNRRLYTDLSPETVSQIRRMPAR